MFAITEQGGARGLPISWMSSRFSPIPAAMCSMM